MVSQPPLISVVVPAHGRPLRLRWLLNALEEQTLPRDAYEVIVATTQAEPAGVAALHPIGARVVRPHGSAASAQRNAGWRAAAADLVAFTDDDCRPDPGWLAALIAAAERAPGAVLQGTTTPDPYEAALAERAPGAQTLSVTPPTPTGETCNIAYPRALLERCGGFDESLRRACDDTDLLARAIAAGAPLVAVPEARIHHAVEVTSLVAAVRRAQRWSDLPRVVRRHPGLRRHMPLGVFWKPRHARLALAAAAAAGLGRRHPLAAAAACLPWVLAAAPRYGRSPRGLARTAAELPARAVLDAAEMAAVARGAVRERTVVL